MMQAACFRCHVIPSVLQSFLAVEVLYLFADALNST